MKISLYGLKQIELREGVIYRVYKDSRGLLTGGCGHLLSPNERRAYPYNTGLSKQTVDNWLENDLQKCFNAISDLVKVPLAQNEFDALCSFIFNIGVHGFASSSTLRELNKGNYKMAGLKMMLWNIPHEIIGRRKQESVQFLTPYKI